MSGAHVCDGEDPTVALELAELAGVEGRVAWEWIGDEVRPYFRDDPARCAFPDDGRLEVEE